MIGLLWLYSEYNRNNPYKKPKYWYREAVVYALYVDLFAGDFKTLISKLPYLQKLGVNCLWLLPVLDSPMKDAGFDVRNYNAIRGDLLTAPENQNEFDDFLDAAHSSGINVIFDIAINHTSNTHPWFQDALSSTQSRYHDYYIWNKDTELYKECRLIFEGMCPCNWEKAGEEYYFHRFFEFQPDLNYKNPRVFIEMVKIFLFWLKKGVDGFRLDAIPYLWKTEGTDCENLPETHLIIKLFRAIIDMVAPETLLLAEACQPPKEVVKYMGDGDECHAGYHFPLMPQIFKAIAMQSSEPVINVLKPENTPALPESCQWFLFLRLHDELSLEKVYVNEDDREFLHKFYCKKNEWDFRLGQGISARLSELMDHDPNKVLLLYSIMFSLQGTPLIYYGDEFGKSNDLAYYLKKKTETGYADSRNMVRGYVEWEKTLTEIAREGSIENVLFHGISNMLSVRQKIGIFGTASIEMLNFECKILSYWRTIGNNKILIINNISGNDVKVELPLRVNSKYDLLGNTLAISKKTLLMKPHSYHWIAVE